MFPSRVAPGRTCSRRCLALLAVLVLPACEKGPPPELVATRDSLTATRDSLRNALTERAALLREVAAELAKAAPPDTTLLTGRGALPRTLADTVLAQALLMTRRFSELRGEFEGARGRAGTLSRRVDSLRTAMAGAVAARDSTIQAQGERIAALTSEVANLEGAQSRLQRRAEVLADSAGAMLSEANRVYYMIGTKEELIRQGAVVAEPGPRFLYFLWHQGESLLPARTLDPARFQTAERREWTTVPLPNPALRYRLLSRQDLSATDARPDDKGWIVGSGIRITDPERFWRGSRFLILVQER